MIIVIGYKNYINHKNTAIRQQQENLMTIAKTISRSLDVFLNYKTNGLAMLTKEPIILEALMMYENNEIKYQNEEKILEIFERYIDDIDSLKLYNVEGDLIYESLSENLMMETHTYNSLINKVLSDKSHIITKEYLSKPGQFSIDIAYPVIDDGEVYGILIETINLNRVYDYLIHIVQPGEKGYAMVKNREGFIVMHPVPDQVGIESIKVRKAMYPDYDWSELEELYRRQLEEGEGYFVYNSKWWQDIDKKATKN